MRCHLAFFLGVCILKPKTLKKVDGFSYFTLGSRVPDHPNIEGGDGGSGIEWVGVLRKIDYGHCEEREKN